MNLEQLLARAKEIEGAILNMTAQLNALHGHKTEVAHWISQLQGDGSPTDAILDEPDVSPMVQ